MSDPAFRPATSADSEFAYAVRKAAFREYIERIWGWNELEQWRLHERRFVAQDVRIASLSGEDVGVMALAVTPEAVKVNQLFILPEHQGKGIGRSCMLLVLKEAQRLGLPVRLQVLKVNPRALAFYERLGFVRTGASDTHLLMEWDGHDPGQVALAPER